jgi:hypothetical protein
LGITIDFELNFNIANICKKASRQLNILKRIGKYFITKLGRHGILAVFWYLKEYLLCLIVIKSCKYKGLFLLTILNVSMAIVIIRLIFKVGNFGNHNRF